jgi:hypothetical protein
MRQSELMGSGARATRAGQASASPAKAPEPVASARAPPGYRGRLNFPRRSLGSRG